MRQETRSGSIPTPAAGAGFTYQFSPNRRTNIQSVLFTLTTSATVANRFIWAQLQDPNGTPVFQAGSPTAIAASSAADIVLSPTFSTPAAMQGPVNTTVGLALPKFWLPPAWTLHVGAAGIAAGDQFTTINYAVHYSEDAWHEDQDAATYAALLAAFG